MDALAAGLDATVQMIDTSVVRVHRLYRAHNLIERFFNSPPTTSPSSNSHQSEFGCVLMSPRPNLRGGMTSCGRWSRKL
jgi:hypothetical protein